MCDHCGTTYCLDHVEVPAIALPTGFNVNQVDVVVSGKCMKCQ